MTVKTEPYMFVVNLKPQYDKWLVRKNLTPKDDEARFMLDELFDLVSDSVEREDFVRVMVKGWK